MRVGSRETTMEAHGHPGGRWPRIYRKVDRGDIGTCRWIRCGRKGELWEWSWQRWRKGISSGRAEDQEHSFWCRILMNHPSPVGRWVYELRVRKRGMDWRSRVIKVVKHVFGKGSKLMLGRRKATLKRERGVEGKPGTPQTLVQPISLCSLDCRFWKPPLTEISSRHG